MYVYSHVFHACIITYAVFVVQYSCLPYAKVTERRIPHRRDMSRHARTTVDMLLSRKDVNGARLKSV